METLFSILIGFVIGFVVKGLMDDYEHPHRR